MLNEKGFNQAIKVISTVGEKFAESVHEAGIFAISQANEHGNVNFGIRLIDAMGKKHDRQRVVNWLIAFGKFGVVKGVLVFKKRKDIAPENFDAWLVKANNTPYWELTPQKPLVEKVDYLAMLRGIVAKHKNVAKREAEGKEVEESNMHVVAMVEELVAKLAPKKEETTPVAS